MNSKKLKKVRKKFGIGFVNGLNRPIFSIGKDSFTEDDMIQSLKCGKFHAARNLGRVLKEAFKPKGIRELSRRMTYEDLTSTPGIGQASVWVWTYLLDKKGIDPNAWLDGDLKVSTMCGRPKKGSHRRVTVRPRPSNVRDIHEYRLRTA